MARVCMLTGKRGSTGNNKSHSQRRTKRKFSPNLITKRLTDPVSGRTMRLKISTKALRTLTKHLVAGV